MIGYAKDSGGLLLTRSFGFRMPVPRRGMLDLCVDLSAHKERESRDVQPHQKDHHRAKRAVGLAVAVKKVKIGAESEGCRDPEHDSDERTGSDPVPVLLFQIRRKIIYERER